MNKMELVRDVATKAELTQKDAEKAVNALLETIYNTLAKKEKIQLIGFGTFEVRDRAARTGRNPQTGEEVDIPASKVAAFKAGKELKQAVKQHRIFAIIYRKVLGLFHRAFLFAKLYKNSCVDPKRLKLSFIH